MEIKATVIYTDELIRKLTRFNMTKSKALVVILWVCEVIITLVILLMCLAGIVSESLPFLLFFCFMIVFIPAYFIVLPRVYSNAQKNLRGVENSFLFTEDGVHIHSKGPSFDGQSQIKYEMLHEVCETSDCFYIYFTKLQIYPLLKSGVEENRVSDLQNLLFSKMPKGKYKVRR